MITPPSHPDESRWTPIQKKEFDRHTTLTVVTNRAITVLGGADLSSRKPVERANNFADEVMTAMFTFKADEEVDAFHKLVVAFALTQVAVETWQAKKFAFKDATVDRILSDDGKCRELRDFRNAVFHPASVVDPKFLRPIGEQTMATLDWVANLLMAIRAYCLAFNARWAEAGALKLT